MTLLGMHQRLATPFAAYIEGTRQHSIGSRTKAQLMSLAAIAQADINLAQCQPRCAAHLVVPMDHRVLKVDAALLLQPIGKAIVVAAVERDVRQQNGAVRCPAQKQLEAAGAQAAEDDRAAKQGSPRYFGADGGKGQR